jgi:hypothetical protein
MKADIVLRSAVYVGTPTHLSDIGSRFVGTKPGGYVVELTAQPNPAENGRYAATVDAGGMLTVRPGLVHADTFEQDADTSVIGPDEEPTESVSP